MIPNIRKERGSCKVPLPCTETGFLVPSVIMKNYPLAMSAIRRQPLEQEQQDDDVASENRRRSSCSTTTSTTFVERSIHQLIKATACAAKRSEALACGRSISRGKPSSSPREQRLGAFMVSQRPGKIQQIPRLRVS